MREFILSLILALAAFPASADWLCVRPIVGRQIKHSGLVDKILSASSAKKLEFHLGAKDQALLKEIKNKFKVIRYGRFVYLKNAKAKAPLVVDLKKRAEQIVPDVAHGVVVLPRDFVEKAGPKHWRLARALAKQLEEGKRMGASSLLLKKNGGEIFLSMAQEAELFFNLLDAFEKEQVALIEKSIGGLESFLITLQQRVKEFKEKEAEVYRHADIYQFGVIGKKISAEVGEWSLSFFSENKKINNFHVLEGEALEEAAADEDGQGTFLRGIELTLDEIAEKLSDLIKLRNELWHEGMQPAQEKLVSIQERWGHGPLTE